MLRLIHINYLAITCGNYLFFYHRIYIMVKLYEPIHTDFEMKLRYRVQHSIIKYTLILKWAKADIVLFN